MTVRMRHTRAHTGNRRAHHTLKGRRLSSCGKCGSPHLRHIACLNCGTYKGKQVAGILKKAKKKSKKAKASEKK